jgi:hypothetical protein
LEIINGNISAEAAKVKPNLQQPAACICDTKGKGKHQAGSKKGKAANVRAATRGLSGEVFPA